MRRLLLTAILSSLPLSALAQHHEMKGLYGPYAMSREASGTSWQPESTPHEGVHASRGDWMLMGHGFVLGVYDHQGGPRGDDEAFSASMLMGLARRPLGAGTLGLRGMLSLDPAMGASGYPLLLQTGESADGSTPLVDRQHPHDLFMELAATYSLALGDASSAFAYFGLPGEPALGPPVFMHRFSGADNPEAPLGHHWLDSTHITYGVATLGATFSALKLEGSAFHGREPDHRRWDIEKPEFDSWSGRLSFNPTRDWALQASAGRLEEPEALEHGVDQDRLTASVSRNFHPGGRLLQTTLAWGRIWRTEHHASDALLLESAFNWRDGHTAFARWERVEKDELGEEAAGEEAHAPAVNKVSLGYAWDFARWRRTAWGVGAVGSLHLLPAALEAVYGKTPASFMVFLRAKLG